LASVMICVCIPAYAQAQNRLPKGATKEEVMRKIPGLVIDDEGNATMNGEPVSIISLDYSVKAQPSEQSKPDTGILILGPSFNDEDTTLKRLTADMIEKVKAYVPPTVLKEYEYIIEINSISDDFNADTKIEKDPSDNKILTIPEGITIKDLLNQLPGVETDTKGRMITKSRKDIVTSIEFNGGKVYPENISIDYPDDYKLHSGVIHVIIIDRKHFKKYMSKKDRDDLPKRRAEIVISHYPRMNAFDLLWEIDRNESELKTSR